MMAAKPSSWTYGPHGGVLLGATSRTWRKRSGWLWRIRGPPVRCTTWRKPMGPISRVGFRSWQEPLGGAVAIVIVFKMRWFYRRWLGGVTGDLIGACGELVEIAVLVTM